MIVYFIRHGSVEYPVDESGRSLVYGPNAGLSHEGSSKIIQAAQIIREREGRRFDTLITSPYTRAKETAVIFAKVMRIDPGRIVEDDRLRDTDSTWPCEPVDLFLNVWHKRKVFEDPHTRETLEDLRTRMIAAVNEQTGRFPARMIGFIGHGDPFRAWLFPHERPFRSYENLVKSTFENAEGMRAVINEDGQIKTEIIRDFCEWNF